MEFNVKDYGALGDGISNDTQAFIAASAALSAHGGGVLRIPQGVYVVGEQTLAGQLGLGYAYRSTDIISIVNCQQPVVIEGNHAVLRAAPGLRYGSFDPVSGEPYAPAAMPFIDPDYAAGAYRMLVLANNRHVLVRDLELDGASDTLILGGGWGDLGRQLNAYGVYALNNNTLQVENVHTHHHGLDGILVSQVGTTAQSPRTPATLIRVRSEYNGRQGLSWTGGNGLTAIDCQFNHTSRGALSSSPAAGIDIEAEDGVVRNGLFINCEVINNVGPGMGADSGDSADITFQRCTFIGSTNYPLWPRKPRLHFLDCTIAGQLVNVYAEQTPGDGNATRFTGCRFTDQLNWNGQVHLYPGWYLLDLGGGSQGVMFDRCSMDTQHGPLIYTAGEITLRDCRLTQTTSHESTFSACYVGYNLAFSPPGAFTTGMARVLGQLLVNGEEAPQYVGIQRKQCLQGNNGGAYAVRQSIAYAYSPEAAVGAGQANRGDIVYNPYAAPGGYAGWICVEAGSPGIWKPFGPIAL